MSGCQRRLDTREGPRAGRKYCAQAAVASVRQGRHRLPVCAVHLDYFLARGWSRVPTLELVK